MASSFLSVADLDSREFNRLVTDALHIKAAMERGKSITTLKGKIIGILFEKPSTRTRTSFQAATIRMGGSGIYLSANELQLSRGEARERCGTHVRRLAGCDSSASIFARYSDATG
ncbi:ornithine carbamoyltransferase [mine drainage metagenome]|uniref:Ornithine carbamoyltransferase n=1 Tax=mine drainage metagenome TaxID=410659 RepID=T1AVG4_9ZZZZ